MALTFALRCQFKRMTVAADPSGGVAPPGPVGPGRSVRRCRRPRACSQKVSRPFASPTSSLITESRTGEMSWPDARRSRPAGRISRTLAANRITHAGRGLVHEIRVATGNRGRVEVHPAHAPAFRELLPEPRIHQDPVDARGEARRVVGAREQARLAVVHALAWPIVAVRRDNRGAARPRLHQDGGEALPAGRPDGRRRPRDPGPGNLDESP